jgi:hypothetical protein
MKRLVPALILGLLALPDAGASQNAGDGGLRRAVAALGDSAHVQVLAPGVLVEDGYFLGLRLDSLHVASADAVITVGLDEIEGLSVEGSRWKSGTVQGGLIGLVAGATAGFFLGYGHCGNQFQGCDEHAWTVALRWGMVFGAGGAVAGGAVGSRVRRWRSVFP